MLISRKSVTPMEPSNLEEVAELRSRALEAGYVYLKSALPHETVDAVRQVFLDELTRLGWIHRDAGECRLAKRPKDPEATVIQAPIQGSKPFGNLRREPVIYQVLDQLLGSPAHAGWGDVCRIGIPGMSHWTTPPHQDRSYLRGTAKVWTVWIPLSNCPAPLGPLAVLHGSHRCGLLQHDHEGPRGRSLGAIAGDWRSNAFALGDIVFFEDCTIHGALPNETPNQLRLSVDYRFGDRPAGI